MFRLITVFLLAFGLVCASLVPVTAQDPLATPAGNQTDFAAISAAALGADPNALLTGLETPPADELLPAGFINPPGGEPANADIVEAFVIPVDGLEGTIGGVTHAFDTDPAVIGGLVSAGVVNYIVADSEVTAEDFDAFQQGVEIGIGENLGAGMVGDVERSNVAGQDALLISVLLEDTGGVGLVFMLAVPVGNTIVIGTVVFVDSAGVDSTAILEHTVLLTLSGVAYLGEIAGAGVS